MTQTHYCPACDVTKVEAKGAWCLDCLRKAADETKKEIERRKSKKPSS